MVFWQFQVEWKLINSLKFAFNTFNATGLFLYPMKTLENLYRKRPAAWNGLIWSKIWRQFLIYLIQWNLSKVDTLRARNWCPHQRINRGLPLYFLNFCWRHQWSYRNVWCDIINPLLHIPKYLDTLWKSCNECCKIFEVYLTISRHDALKR